MLCVDATPAVTFTSFARCGQGLFRNQVDAEYNPCYNRALHPMLECLIANRWNAALRKNPILHNNSKFRLARIGYGAGHATLKIGTTCCYDYLGTNCLPLNDAQCWEEQGMCDFGDKAAYMANPLECGVLLHTDWDEYIMIRRLFQCCERKSCIDRVTALPCPTNVDLNSCSLRDFIFDSVLQAVEDELGIPRQCLTDPELLGLLQNRQRSWSPSLEFYCRVTNILKKDIYFRFLRFKNALRNVPCATEVVFAYWPEMNDISSKLYQTYGEQVKGALLLYRELNCR